jgi:nucleotide-binding universal stress UspA family protein
LRSTFSSIDRGFSFLFIGRNRGKRFAPFNRSASGDHAGRNPINHLDIFAFLLNRMRKERPENLNAPQAQHLPIVYVRKNQQTKGEIMKILIGTDGSKYSRKAIEECCRMFAEKKTLQIKIISNYEAVAPLDAFAATIQFSGERDQAVQERAESFVAEAVEIITKQLPNATTTTAVAMDFPERFIVEEAKNWEADLIVVGSHGRGFWERLTLGSVSNAVIHHAPCSVLVVYGID